MALFNCFWISCANETNILPTILAYFLSAEEIRNKTIKTIYLRKQLDLDEKPCFSEWYAYAPPDSHVKPVKMTPLGSFLNVTVNFWNSS